jgi:hypothetical protein
MAPTPTKKLASIAFVGAATAATVGYNMAPAFAASQWNIKNGTAGYHGAIAGKNVGNTILKDTTHNVTLTCTKASVSGSAPASHVAVTGSSTKVGVLKKANFSTCSFLGVTFKAHLLKNAGIFAKTFAAGVTHGNVNSISAMVSGVNIPGCHFKVVGTHLPMVFKNASHHFVVDSTSVAALSLKSVAALCPTVKTNDKAFFKGTFAITTPAALNVSKS